MLNYLKVPIFLCKRLVKVCYKFDAIYKNKQLGFASVIYILRLMTFLRGLTLYSTDYESLD